MNEYDIISNQYHVSFVNPFEIPQGIEIGLIFQKQPNIK